MVASASLIDSIEKQLDLKLFSSQLDAVNLLFDQDEKARMLLHYRTGRGKTIAALAALASRGHSTALIIAPPAAHKQWQDVAAKLDIDVTTISHATFRMATFKPSRWEPIVADEFHLFGGHAGKGWRKLDRVAANLRAPLILLSATPNYNDAERVYCVQHILQPEKVRGGYIQFLYENCITENNPFGSTPLVQGFRNFPDAASYLNSLPNVLQVLSDMTPTVVDVPVRTPLPDEFYSLNYNERTKRIVASYMEHKFQEMYLTLVNEEGLIYDHIYQELIELTGQATTPVLMYATSSQVALALHRTCLAHEAKAGLVTGDLTTKAKEQVIQQFKAKEFDVLIGTATLATGTDGMDKMCDTLIIVQDTEDDAFRDQLMGRILPRGTDTMWEHKQFFRLTY